MLGNAHDNIGVRGGFPRSFLADIEEDSLVWREGFIRVKKDILWARKFLYCRLRGCMDLTLKIRDKLRSGNLVSGR